MDGSHCRADGHLAYIWARRKAPSPLPTKATPMPRRSLTRTHPRFPPTTPPQTTRKAIFRACFLLRTYLTSPCSLRELSESSLRFARSEPFGNKLDNWRNPLAGGPAFRCHNHTAGAPSFALFAKGGYLTDRTTGFAFHARCASIRAQALSRT